MRITLHAGHNPSGKIACGASDYIDESNESRALVKLMKQYKPKDLTITDCTVNNGTSQNDVLKKICAKCNAVKRDMDVSIHFNAASHSPKDGKVKGCEVWLYDGSDDCLRAAYRVLKEMRKLGFTSRGVKRSKSLYFSKHTSKPAMLIEVCFVDDRDDATLYVRNRDKIAKALVNAISQ